MHWTMQVSQEQQDKIQDILVIVNPDTAESDALQQELNEIRTSQAQQVQQLSLTLGMMYDNNQLSGLLPNEFSLLKRSCQILIETILLGFSAYY